MLFLSVLIAVLTRSVDGLVSVRLFPRLESLSKDPSHLLVESDVPLGILDVTVRMRVGEIVGLNVDGTEGTSNQQEVFVELDVCAAHAEINSLIESFGDRDSLSIFELHPRPARSEMEIELPLADRVIEARYMKPILAEGLDFESCSLRRRVARMLETALLIRETRLPLLAVVSERSIADPSPRFTRLSAAKNGNNPRSLNR
jgi:hypothetical protein